MDNPMTRDELFSLISGVSYNVDGSVDRSTEVIRNYKMFLNSDNKVEIELYNRPVEILVEGDWVDIESLVREEDIQILSGMFSEVHLDGRIVLDTSNMEGLSVRGRSRVPRLDTQMEYSGIQYPREFAWVDGASEISGVIELPQDDYSEVFIATDPNKDGEPDIVFIPPKTEVEQERPYYVKEDGKTYIYVNHFSGGGGVQADPYIVSDENDLDNVRNNLGAYYIQDRDILMTRFQTGQGFAPIKNFSGYYDGRGFEIKDLFMNRSENNVGLFGYQTGGEIKRVKLVNATVKAGDTNNYVGALVGRADSIVSDCAVVSGTVEGGGYVGGLVGYQVGSSSMVRRCYSHADVIGYTNMVGGLVGNNSADAANLTKCLSTGKVLDGSLSQTATNLGGFVGGGYAGADNFYNVDTSGRSTTAGSAVGLTTAELRKQETYERAGWDFDLWFTFATSKQNKGYPEPRKFWRYAKGKGTESDPFLIYTAEELNQVRHFLYANFRLENDIALNYPTTGKGFTPIGYDGTGIGWTDLAFTGVLDGNGKTIGNLYINRATEDSLGLFRNMRGIVRNLSIVDANITGKNYVAALAGYTNARNGGGNAKIENCQVRGFSGSSIRGNSHVAGLLGQTSNVDVTDCLVENVEVNGSGNYTAGFVGHVSSNSTFLRCVSRKSRILGSGTYASGFYGFIAADVDKIQFFDCYARNEISCASAPAGFGGYFSIYSTSGRTYAFERCLSESYCSDGSACPMFAYLNNSYGYPISSTVISCFFDRTLANYGSAVNMGAQAKYTPEMKHPSTFGAFDLVGTWVLDSKENDGYPELVKFMKKALPILGFRNQFGDYYTDAAGNILRHLEYGTLVAGSTSDAKPVWLQNNADFPVTQMKVWVDPPTVKPGITVELSLTDNPFVPTSEIVFAGSVPVKDARKFFVRFSSDVTVTESGTFDMKAKASPVQ